MFRIESKAWQVYRLFDQKRGLLYVGISCSPASRISAHLREKWWADEVVHAEIDPEIHRSRWVAQNVERQVIRDEDPKYNIQRAGVADA